MNELEAEAVFIQGSDMRTTAELKDLAGNLSTVITRVLAGNEVILTKANQPVARIVRIQKSQKREALPPLKIRSLSRPRVLAPKITGAEIAEEMFNRERTK